MRVMVFFDLPVGTTAERREYARFRKGLIRDGFVMMQESVYCKLALNPTVAGRIMDGVQAQNALFLPLCRVSAACFITHPHGFLSLPEKAKTPDDSWAFLMFCDVLCAHAFFPLFWRSPVAAPYRSWVTVGATLGCRPNLPGV